MKRGWILAIVVAFVVTEAFIACCGGRNMTLFSNDGPLGSQMSQTTRVPDMYYGAWHDLNSIGYEDVHPLSLSLTSSLRTMCHFRLFEPVAWTVWLGSIGVLFGMPTPRRQTVLYGIGNLCCLAVVWTLWFMVKGPDAEMLATLVSLDGIVLVGSVFALCLIL